jgi:hypothetical protein
VQIIVKEQNSYLAEHKNAQVSIVQRKVQKAIDRLKGYG